MEAFNYSLEPGRILNDNYDMEKISQIYSPLISVITAYYNAGKYFEQTFRCLMNQTFPWFEWIIVDDGSTNKEDIKLLNRLASIDGRISIIRQSNGGAASARNNGIRNSNSKSEIIVFLDADDLIDSRFLEMTYWGLLCNEEVKWAYTDSVGFGGAEYTWEKEFSSEKMKEENILPYAAAIRKDVFDNDIYDDGLCNNWEDWQFWLKMLAKGYRPFHIRKKMFWYRRHDAGMLSKIEKDDGLKEELLKRIGLLAESVPDGIRAVISDSGKGLEFEDEKMVEWDRALPYKGGEKIMILLLLPHMKCGGADQFNLDIIRKLNREKYRIGVITTNEDVNEWEQKFAEELDDVFELPTFLQQKDWMRFVYYYIKSRQVNIVFNISSYWAYYILPLIRIDFPEIAVIDCIHAEGRYWRNGGYPRVTGKFSSIVERSFVTNDFTRKVLAEKYGVPYNKMRLIYTGVDDTVFCEEKIECDREREVYNIADKRPVILYLCRLCPEKRPFLMLEIAEKVKEIIPNVQFLVVGEGEYYEDMRSNAHEMGLEEHVVFTGYVEDTKPFYKIADLFLLCSLKEGLSITTMEAMAMGMPVISADVGSQYELVNDDTGKLIACRADEERDLYNRNNDPQEVQDFANAICEWIDKLNRNREGIKWVCREKVKNGFTVGNLLERLETEFEELVSEDTVVKRKKMAEDLKIHKGLFEELLMLYNSFSRKEIETNAIWEAREYFYTQWMNEREEKERIYNNFRKKEMEADEIWKAREYFYKQWMEERGEKKKIENELKKIYSSKVWKLIKGELKSKFHP